MLILVGIFKSQYFPNNVAHDIGVIEHQMVIEMAMLSF
jgi:hypothetical protein